MRFDIFLFVDLKIEKAKKNWSGIQGLLTYTMKNLIEFIRIGGFIRDVKISSNRAHITKEFQKMFSHLGFLNISDKGI